MTTFKLLFGTTWRGGVFGLIAGTALGLLYGAVFFNALLFFGWLSEMPVNFESSDALRMGVVVPFLALIGAIMGGAFGIPTGFAVGLLNGLLVGLITRLFFFPLRDTRTYRRTIMLISTVFTAIASWFGFYAMMLLYANIEKANVPMLALIITLPAVIAGMAAGLISQIGARWYERELTKGSAQNVASN